LEELITSQVNGNEVFEIDDHEYAKYLKHKVRRPEGEVTVSIPQDAEHEEEVTPRAEVRESIKIQALLAKIDAQMGLKIWLPRNDRNAVLSEWGAGEDDLLENLPLNYDETTIKTIEQIDVLWLRRRAIIRAFEVEHTTSIYSCARKGCQIARGKHERAETNFCQWPLSQAARALAIKIAPSRFH
jgi:hypothetical protein